MFQIWFALEAVQDQSWGWFPSAVFPSVRSMHLPWSFQLNLHNNNTYHKRGGKGGARISIAYNKNEGTLEKTHVVSQILYQNC